MMRDFFNVQEAADELTAQTGDKWTNGNVLQKAAAGVLPVCFLYRGNLGIFSGPTKNGLHYSDRNFYWVGYLRSNDVQMSLPIGRNSGKTDLLCANNVTVVMPAQGYGPIEILCNKKLHPSGESGQYLPCIVRTNEWLFHADDLARLIDEDKRRLQLAQPDHASLPISSSPGPHAKKRKRHGWREVALPYMIEVFKSGQFSTAKAYYKALIAKAGDGQSPFDRGTGPNAHSLFVRETGTTLALKTVQTAMPKIRSIQK